MDTNEKIKIVGTNIQEKANLIWNVANSLFGAYKPHEYGLVILPLVVIKRFHDCLLPTREKVLATYEKVKQLAVKDGFLRTASGYRFYNTSQYTFERLKADPENIKTNFEAYINGFSDNVIDILANMGFFTQIERMADAGVLYQVISDFTADNADMNPEKISAIDMGYVFENLVQRFSESYDEEAGAHFTSRDIIYLMCDLLTMNFLVKMLPPRLYMIWRWVPVRCLPVWKSASTPLTKRQKSSAMVRKSTRLLLVSPKRIC